MNISINRISRDAQDFYAGHKKQVGYATAVIALLAVYAFSKGGDTRTTVYQSDSKVDFKDAKVLGSHGDSIYEGKEKLLAKTVKDLQLAQVNLKEANEKLLSRLEQVEKGKPPTPTTVGAPETAPNPPAAVGEQQDPIKIGAPSGLNAGTVSGYEAATPVVRRSGFRGTRYRTENDGASIISFPVKEVTVERDASVVVPTGSYVKAKLMTGVEAPEGKTYPVLLQLDYAFIVPNKKKIDLTGCFMIAKSTGDLSIERVQMQAEKMSCVSKDGKMFEREVNGFIADDKDNSFAVIGNVNSKQDRVAAMAFLSSVVEGIGKAVQLAQTTQSTTPLGGQQSMVTGDQAKYIGAGGAANAATMVTQWYLHQAQNLLPTINIGSGQDVWVVMKDTVKLPNDYFQKPTKGGSDNVYTYFSRIAD
ncbi:MAG: TraB/VirB10 family protein [Bacteriovoracia bacterium]